MSNYWLIERGQPEGQIPTLWWCGNYMSLESQWTERAIEAFRFDSKELAERTAWDALGHYVGTPTYRVTEHIYLERPSPQPESAAKDDDRFCIVHPDRRELDALLARPKGAAALGSALAVRVLQSDLYKQLDDTELAECDELILRWHDWLAQNNAAGQVPVSASAGDARSEEPGSSLQQNEAVSDCGNRNLAAYSPASAAPSSPSEKHSEGPTPRTDVAAGHTKQWIEWTHKGGELDGVRDGGYEWKENDTVPTDFARQLERELAEAKHDLASAVANHAADLSAVSARPAMPRKLLGDEFAGSYEAGWNDALAIATTMPTKLNYQDAGADFVRGWNECIDALQSARLDGRSERKEQG